MSVINRSPYRVIYGDTDQMGVVYYANYLRLFERGRCEIMRQVGLDYAQVERQGIIVPVVDAHVRYLRPARFDDLVVIETRVSEVGRVRFSFAYRILRDDDGVETVLAEGTTQHACLNKDGRPVRVPLEIRRLLAAGEGDAA